MNKIKDKSDVIKFFRRVFYLIGFPLVALLVLISLMPYINQPFFADTFWMYLVLILGIWAIFEICRLIVNKTCKGRMGRMVILSILCAVMMITPILATDYAYVKPTYAAAKADYDAVQFSYYENGSTTKTVVKLSDTTPMETLEKEMGWYKVVTKKARLNKSLTYQTLELVDKFCEDYQIDKFFNFKDYTFKNYKDDMGYKNFGKLDGFQTTLDKQIAYYEEYITAYNTAMEENGHDVGAIDEDVRAKMDIVINGGQLQSQDSTLIFNAWSYNDLQALRVYASYRDTFYPYFASRKFMLMGIGLTVLSVILVTYCSAVLAAPKKKKEEDATDADAAEEEVADNVENPVEANEAEFAFAPVADAPVAEAPVAAAGKKGKAKKQKKAAIAEAAPAAPQAFDAPTPEFFEAPAAADEGTAFPADQNN